MKTKIKKGMVVSFHYVLKDKKKKVLESSRGDGGDPLVYLHGYKQLIKGLERALTGKVIGDTFSVVVAPKDGYGPHKKKLVMTVEKKVLGISGKPRVGDIFQLGDDEDSQVFRVTNLKGDTVTLDGNHPFAGETLSFQIEVMAVRQATKSELKVGKAG